MKLAFFDEFKLGVVKGDTVVDVSDAVRDIPRLGPQDVINGVIADFGTWKPRLEAAAAAGKGIPLANVRLRSPLPKPFNIDCMACLLYTSPSPRDRTRSRMPSSA